MRTFSIFAAVAWICGGALSCAPAKPVGPPNDANVMPWNPPLPGQGAGQLGMVPQINQRR